MLASAFLSIALRYLGVEVGLSMLPNAWWSSPFIVLGGNKVVGVWCPALSWLGPLWHWAVAPSASMLHCTVAVCSVASLTGSQSAEDTR